MPEWYRRHVNETFQFRETQVRLMDQAERTDLLRCEIRANAAMPNGRVRRAEAMSRARSEAFSLSVATTRLRPSCLARYRAASAFAIRASIGIVASYEAVAPMLTVAPIGWLSITAPAF